MPRAPSPAAASSCARVPPRCSSTPGSSRAASEIGWPTGSPSRWIRRRSTPSCSPTPTSITAAGFRAWSATASTVRSCARRRPATCAPSSCPTPPTSRRNRRGSPTSAGSASTIPHCRCTTPTTPPPRCRCSEACRSGPTPMSPPVWSPGWCLPATSSDPRACTSRSPTTARRRTAAPPPCSSAATSAGVRTRWLPAPARRRPPTPCSSSPPTVIRSIPTTPTRSRSSPTSSAAPQREAGSC